MPQCLKHWQQDRQKDLASNNTLPKYKINICLLQSPNVLTAKDHTKIEISPLVTKTIHNIKNRNQHHALQDKSQKAHQQSHLGIISFCRIIIKLLKMKEL